MMKVVANYPDLATAELAKSVLKARGIPALIPDSNLAGIDWRMGTAIGGIRLQVDESQAEAATELLNAGKADEADPGNEEFTPDEVCPHCQSTRIGPDDHRRLKALTLLLHPVAFISVPLILLIPKKVRCSDCGETWH